MLKGPYSQRFFLKKKRWDLAHSECSKIRYYHPKFNNFKYNKSAIIKISFAVSFSNINPDAHASTLVKKSTFYMKVWGQQLPRNQFFF